MERELTLFKSVYLRSIFLCKNGGKIMKANKDLRDAMEERRIKQYEVADVLGISESGFCRMLRKELPEEKKKEIFEAIKNMEL